jgi:hypothetical protein
VLETGAGARVVCEAMDCGAWARARCGWEAGKRECPPRLNSGWIQTGEKLRAGGVGWKQPRRHAAVRCESRKEKTAVIIGAGPAGAFLALLLARHDWKVDVFERKQWRSGTWAPEQPDGWSVMLGARAAHCLEHLGLKENVWSEGVLCAGRTAVTGTRSILSKQAQGLGFKVFSPFRVQVAD